MNTKVIGQRLIELRGERKREEVANAIGVSKSAIAMYEAGERVPRDPLKLKIANYYNKTVEEIFLLNKYTIRKILRKVKHDT